MECVIGMAKAKLVDVQKSDEMISELNIRLELEHDHSVRAQREGTI